MSYQETPTLLSVARWGQILGINPLSLQQVDVASSYSSESLCGQPTLQYAWQDNQRTGREDIARAISTAEAMIKSELGYAVLPEWVSQEVTLHDQDWRPEIYPWNAQAVRGMPRTQTLGEGYFIGGGQRAVAVISASAAITYSDEDGDGYDETATVGPVATTVTDANQIAVYYRAADTPDGEAADDRWEIRPIRVSISGGAVTVTFRRELAVIASLMLPLEPQAVDGTVNANFLTHVSVYQRYTDPTTSVRFEWEPGGSWSSCSSATCVSCSYTVQTGCLLSHDDRNSIVRVAAATYDAATATWSSAGWTACRAPDRITAWYRAGYRDQSRARPYYEMDRRLEEAVAYLSVSLLERPVCGCTNVAGIFEAYRSDLALSLSNESGGSSWQISSSDLDNPFGTRRGAVAAWKMIDRLSLGRAAVG